MKSKPFSLAGVVMLVAFGFAVPANGFEPAEWSVRCWDGMTKRWQDRGLSAMTLTESEGVTKITNTSGIHRHAHLVFPAELTGDFTFTIELKGGYELGFLNREGKDEMLYVELSEGEEFETFTLSRRGTRISIERNGRAVPLVHFRFDYGEDFMIVLGIKEAESAAIRSYNLELNS
ncbi:MAG: hypothetical protein P1U58_01185 [Verrucomicrobiales bacterium]|nr:hypothetical protein [Verrucomicrobiales bacterium]